MTDSNHATGFEVLDDLRKRSVQFLANSTSFLDTFNRITKHILQDLDWSNVILVGDMVLTTLMHTDPTGDDIKIVRDAGLDIYIHGLDPQNANKKAEEIHDIWAANLPASVERGVVKSPGVITLIPSYPYRRIQIVLQLAPSPTDVLLNLDLDPCAIAFDGTSVFMLPRCARAIETGYINFTNDLIFGHHLSGRIATTQFRLFEYAQRGFGVRFLPSFARFLQSDQCTNKEAASWMVNRSRNACSTDEQRDRWPFGPTEPGLMTLKRVAYLGQDYVKRFAFGPTALTKYPGPQPFVLGPHGAKLIDPCLWKNEQEWRKLVDKVSEWSRGSVGQIR